MIYLPQILEAVDDYGYLTITEKQKIMCTLYHSLCGSVCASERESKDGRESGDPPLRRVEDN